MSCNQMKILQVSGEVRACECSKEMYHEQSAEERDKLQVCYQSKKKGQKEE